MRGEARLLCVLGLVLLCVAANFQGAYCLGEGGRGDGGAGGGGDAGGGYSGGSISGDEARQAVYGAGSAALAGTGSGYLVGGVIRGPHSAAGEPQGHVASRASGTAGFLAAAVLVWWL